MVFIIFSAIIITSVLLGFWKIQQAGAYKSNQTIIFGLISLSIVGLVLAIVSGHFYAILICLIALTPLYPFGIRLFQHSYYEQQAYQNVARYTAPTLMTREEALSILGLDEIATDVEIKKAHKAMLLRVHPDQGGSDYLTQKVNQARDILIENSSFKVQETIY